MTLVKVGGMEVELHEDGFIYSEVGGEDNAFCFEPGAVTSEFKQACHVFTEKLSRMVSELLEDNKDSIEIGKSLIREHGEIMGTYK